MAKTKETRLQALIKLRDKLHSIIYGDACDPKSLAALVKQYRETLLEIEEIEGQEDNGDEISEILSARKADGKSGAVRKSST